MPVYVISNQKLQLSTALSTLSLNECGKSYSCWAFPPNCDDRSCDGIVRWKRIGDSVLFEWQAKDNLGEVSEGRYSSIAISNDEYMGDDTVLECVFSPNGVGRVQMSFNAAYSNLPLPIASNRVLRNKQAVMRDGKMICSANFEISEIAGLPLMEKKRVHDLNRKKYMIQYAKGLADRSTLTKKVHGTNNINEFYPWSTNEAVRFCERCSDSRKIVTEMGQ
uniref:DOMON domain-containing protein n=1 Tax=Syphacia muris TaxID=451379 RepID=A0A0N5AUE6_9BILA